MAHVRTVLTIGCCALSALASAAPNEIKVFTDELARGRKRIGDDELEALGVRLGEVALAALRTR